MLLRWRTDDSYLRMPLRALLARIAVSILLLFAQQQAMLHELQHGIDAVSGKTNPASPLHEVCLQCVALAGVDSAPPSTAPVLALADLPQPLAAAPLRAAQSSAQRTVYDSRAPPLNS